MINHGHPSAFTLSFRNVNDGFIRLLNIVEKYGVIQESRNGKVKSLPTTVMFEVRQPWEKVLFSPRRDANPIFHLMEAVWMLAGARDVAFLDQFNKNMKNYSDDGVVFNAAYGYRWAAHFGFDQIEEVVSRLKVDPHDRRTVITMWDPQDLLKDTRDMACNCQIMPRVVGDRLDFLITNRSNDLVFGAMGANAVHMSFLQEWLAVSLGLRCGMWHHVSANLHVYEQHFGFLDTSSEDQTWLWKGYPGFQPLVAPGEDAALFRAECVQLVGGKLDGFQSRFLEDTVEPVYASWREWKGGDKEEALEIARSIEANDWRRAVVSWYNRRMK